MQCQVDQRRRSFLQHTSLVSCQVACAVVPALVPVRGRAEESRYHVLSLTVQTALREKVRSVSYPALEPRFESSSQRKRWLERMRSRLPSSRFSTEEYADRFLLTLRYEAQRAGLDPQLLLALVQIESAFQRYAISSGGARGYTQVMPFWAKLLANQGPSILFDTRSNLRFGCTILRHYLDIERGNLFFALGRYNGSRGKPTYPRKVLSAGLRRWDLKI